MYSRTGTTDEDYEEKDIVAEALASVFDVDNSKFEEERRTAVIFFGVTIGSIILGILFLLVKFCRRKYNRRHNPDPDSDGDLQNY